MAKQSVSFHKGYKNGYNNPGQYNQQKLLNSNKDIARGIIAGILKRTEDIKNNTVIFK